VNLGSIYSSLSDAQIFQPGGFAFTSPGFPLTIPLPFILAQPAKLGIGIVGPGWPILVFDQFISAIATCGRTFLTPAMCSPDMTGKLLPGIVTIKHLVTVGAFHYFSVCHGYLLVA
jgi:hypothetical protein